MKTKCNTCWIEYDDEFRSTLCPHPTFPANDGNNTFQHQVDSAGPKSKGQPCPKCGEQLIMGFGLAGGGFGPYTMCPTGCKEGFEKFPEGDA